MDTFFSADFGEILSRLTDIVRDPSSNPKIAALLIAVVTLVVVILLLIGVMVIMTRPDDDAEWEDEEYWDEEEEEGGYAEPAVPRSRLVGIALALAVVAAAWVSTGLVTAQQSLCVACHAGSPHAQAKGGTDPHGTVGCIDCHEPGGPVGSVTFMVPPRAIHFVTGIISTKRTDDYSRSVPSSACLRCHPNVGSGTITIDKQGVRVSHKEPMAAGATCVDCHELAAGVVSGRTVGMTPCLRCHDGKRAASACATCHTKDIAAAVRPSNDTTVGPQSLIDTPNCYSCHPSSKPCDACHGIRMPHTGRFMAGGHAREAAIDLWTNGGKTCSRCHTATHMPCSRCHSYTASVPSHGTSWRIAHQYGDPRNCSIGCHGQQTGNGTRPICEFCHDSSIKPRKPLVPAPASVTTTGTGG